MAISASQIIRNIKTEKTVLLELVKGEGYWYFVFDDTERKIYETRSVYCKYLNHMEISSWVYDGQAFVDEMEKKFG